jgi:hypothetical protein
VSAEAATPAADAPELGKLTRLLPIAVLASAVCLFASELMTLFEFTPEGGIAQCAIDNGARHSNAQMVVAGFAVVGVLMAVLAGSRPAAYAVAAMGILALLIFLIADLRFANTVGTLSEECGAGSSFFDAKAVPQGGFYLELAGALGLAVTGIALATLTPAQLSSLRPAPRKRATEPRTASAKEPKPPRHPGEGNRLSRLARRPRARQRAE